MSEDNFEIIKEFRSVDGVVATITARLRNGRRNYTYSLKKEFDKEGGVAQTPWLQKQHLKAARALLDQVEEFIQQAEDVDRAAYRDRLAK